MSFLNALKPVLRGQSAVTVRLTATDAGGFRLLVTPSLQGINADTDDVELAHLQALLAAPFTLALPADSDLDQALADAVAQYQTLREPKLNELDALRARMAAAEADAKKRAEDAKEAAKAKAAKAKTTPTKVASKPQPAPPPTGDMFGTLPEAPQTPAAEASATATGEAEGEATDDADSEEELA